MSGTESESLCLNCGAALTGRYCQDCGQKAASLHVHLHDFFHDAVHEFLHLDGKILNSVKLLAFKPGRLTVEFLEGRRARYISPIRLYLTFSLIFFALAALLPGARESLVRVNPSSGAAPTAEDERQADQLGNALMHNLPRAMFVLMPAFALLTWAFYHRDQPFYVPHLYFSVHFHAFAFLVLSLAMLAGIAGRFGKGFGGVLFLTTIPYHFIALRRVFGGSRGEAFAKGLAVGILYWIVILAAMLGLALDDPHADLSC